MNTSLAVPAPDGVFEGRKKGNIPQAKPGETKFVGITIGAQHGSITKDHVPLDAALGPYIMGHNQRNSYYNFLRNCRPFWGTVSLQPVRRGCRMVWDVSFTCDICGKKKGEANHWWMVMLGDVPCFDEGQPSQRFTLLPWNVAESRNPDMFHLCGQNCAMTAMERFMTHGTIESDLAAHSRR